MRHDSVTNLILVGLGLIGTLLVLIVTASSVGLAPDSYVYLAAAQSLITGHGLTIPVGPQVFVHSSHFPPLYSGLLAFGGLGRIDPLVTGRWLNAFLFGVNICLVGFSINRLSGG